MTPAEARELARVPKKTLFGAGTFTAPEGFEIYAIVPITLGATCTAVERYTGAYAVEEDSHLSADGTGTGAAVALYEPMVGGWSSVTWGSGILRAYFTPIA